MGSISWVLGPTWSFYYNTVASLANHLGLNGVENLSFCLSLALDPQLEYQICFVFLALSVYALVFSFTLTSLYVAISM